jgi:hypothetical protein
MSINNSAQSQYSFYEAAFFAAHKKGQDTSFYSERMDYWDAAIREEEAKEAAKAASKDGKLILATFMAVIVGFSFLGGISWKVADSRGMFDSVAPKVVDIQQ